MSINELCYLAWMKECSFLIPHATPYYYYDVLGNENLLRKPNSQVDLKNVVDSRVEFCARLFDTARDPKRVTMTNSYKFHGPKLGGI